MEQQSNNESTMQVDLTNDSTDSNNNGNNTEIVIDDDSGSNTNPIELESSTDVTMTNSNNNQNIVANNENNNLNTNESSNNPTATTETTTDNSNNRNENMNIDNNNISNNNNRNGSIEQTSIPIEKSNTINNTSTNTINLDSKKKEELLNNNNNNINNESKILFKDLNESLEKFIECLTKNDKENQIFIEDILERKINDLLVNSKRLESYFVSLQNKYSEEKNKIQIKQEIVKVKKEIENKDRLIEKYKNKVKEWKSHFDPLYQSQNQILHSSAQGLSGVENQFSPVFTPMPNTPSILSNLSQPKPSPSLGFGSTIL